MTGDGGLSPHAADKFDWSRARGLEVIPPPARSVRSDPGHAKDGTFGPGHGGGGGGGGEPSGKPSEAGKEAVRKTVADARAQGADVGVSRGAATTPRESKAFERAEAKGGHAVAATDTPKVATTKDGDTATRRFLDPTFQAYARTYPDPSPKRPGRRVGERLVFEGQDPIKASFKARGRALEESKDFMRGEQAESTRGSVKAVKSVPKAVEDAADTGGRPEAGKWWKTRIKIITGPQS